VFNDENNKPSVNINVHSSRPFRNPLSSSTVAGVQSEKCTKRTMDKSVVPLYYSVTGVSSEMFVVC